MAIKELFYDNRPKVLLDLRASQRIDTRFKFTRNTTATYVDQDGIVKTAGINQPRFDFDPVANTARGLAMEPQKTNYIKSSASPGVNFQRSISYTSGAAVSPDSTLTASKIEITSTFIPSFATNASNPGNILSNAALTISAFVKTDFESPVGFTFFFANGLSQNGFVGQFSITSSSCTGNGRIESYPNGWYRIIVNGSTGDVSSLPRLFINPVNPTVGSYLYLWGCQLEFGSSPSSFIYTGASEVTRAADLLSVEAPLPASGSVYIDARAISASENDTLLSLKNSSNDKIDLGFFSNAATYNSVALIANYDGTSKSSLPLPVPTTDRERNIITYGAQNYQYGSGTARFATSLSSSVPTDLNKLSIGHDAVDPTKAFNGYINSVYLWSGELTPAVAEALVRSELDPIDADTFVPTGPAGSLSIVINTQGAAADGDKVFELPAESVANDNDIVITWGDQTESGLEGAAAELGAAGLTKTYTSAGIYSIFVEGKLENLQFNNSASAPDLVQIVRWGTTANGNDVFLSPSTMNGAFYGCSQLDFSSVARTTNLPDTSAVADWTNAFNGCSSITGIFPQFNFSGATSFASAWRGCSSLTAFTAAGGQPQNVTNFTEAWYGCSGLTSFPLIDTSSGTSFASAWFGCSALTSFPSINTSAGTNLSAAWRDCFSLTSFSLINTAACTNFNEAWRNCSSLTSFPLINTSVGTSLVQTWSGCSSLTSFPLINTAAVTNFGAAWESCSSLTSFPLIDTSAGTNFGGSWSTCTNLTSFPLIDTSAGTNFNSTWIFCSNLTSFPLIDTSSGTNFSRAWYENDDLTAFPALDFDSATGLASDAVNTLTGLRDAWFGCGSLATFPANLFNNTTCTRYLNAWTGCALTAASIENIIVSIEAASTSNGNLGLEGGTNAGASTWTAAAVTAYNALVARGWTITRNA